MGGICSSICLGLMLLCWRNYYSAPSAKIYDAHGQGEHNNIRDVDNKSPKHTEMVFATNVDQDVVTV